MYTVNQQQNRGIPDIPCSFTIQINGIEIPFERTVVYKYNDDVKVKSIIIWILPEVTTSIIDKVLLLEIQK
jgi:hypothetical protein